MAFAMLAGCSGGDDPATGAPVADASEGPGAVPAPGQEGDADGPDPDGGGTNSTPAPDGGGPDDGTVSNGTLDGNATLDGNNTADGNVTLAPDPEPVTGECMAGTGGVQTGGGGGLRLNDKPCALDFASKTGNPFVFLRLSYDADPGPGSAGVTVLFSVNGTVAKTADGPGPWVIEAAATEFTPGRALNLGITVQMVGAAAPFEGTARFEAYEVAPA